jgi:hypothetical protein
MFSSVCGCNPKDAWFFKPRKSQTNARSAASLVQITLDRDAEAGDMERTRAGLRDLLAVIGVLAFGCWLGSGHGVHASGDDVQFQLQGINEASSLLVYQPSTKTVYVYRGAMAGNSALQCNFKFELTKPDGVIRRQNCDVQSLLP